MLVEDSKLAMDRVKQTLKSIEETKIVGEEIKRASNEVDKRVSLLLNGYKMSVQLTIEEEEKPSSNETILINDKRSNRSVCGKSVDIKGQSSSHQTTNVIKRDSANSNIAKAAQRSRRKLISPNPPPSPPLSTVLRPRSGVNL